MSQFNVKRGSAVDDDGNVKCRSCRKIVTPSHTKQQDRQVQIRLTITCPRGTYMTARIGCSSFVTARRIISSVSRVCSLFSMTYLFLFQFGVTTPPWRDPGSLRPLSPHPHPLPPVRLKLSGHRQVIKINQTLLKCRRLSNVLETRRKIPPLLVSVKLLAQALITLARPPPA